MKTMFAVLFLATLVALAGCAKKNPVVPQKNVEKIGKFKDYFPMDEGYSWSYKITLPNGSPLYRKSVNWNKNKPTETLDVYGLHIPDQKLPSYNLTLKVLKPSDKFKFKKFDKIFEIGAVSDELGIFNTSKNIYYATSNQPSFKSYRIETFDGQISIGKGDENVLSKTDGEFLQPLYFESKNSKSKNLNINSNNSLVFKGFKNGLIHFVRYVKADKIIKTNDLSVSTLNQDFTEDYWFKRYVGLYRLEQKIAKKTSMVWELEKFTTNNE